MRLHLLEQEKCSGDVKHKRGREREKCRPTKWKQKEQKTLSAADVDYYEVGKGRPRAK